jgi:hypothetical protein
MVSVSAHTRKDAGVPPMVVVSVAIEDICGEWQAWVIDFVV